MEECGADEICDDSGASAPPSVTDPADPQADSVKETISALIDATVVRSCHSSDSKESATREEDEQATSVSPVIPNAHTDACSPLAHTDGGNGRAQQVTVGLAVTTDTATPQTTTTVTRRQQQQRPVSMYGRSLPPSPYPHAASEHRTRSGLVPLPPPPSMPPPTPPSPAHGNPATVFVDYLPTAFNDPEKKRWSVAGSELRSYKYKLESMEAELSQLHVKNLEITKKYHSIVKTLEDTVDSRRRLESSLSEQREENEHLRSEKADCDQQRQILQQQILDMRLKLNDRCEEVEELRHQLRTSSAGPIHHPQANAGQQQQSDGGIAPGWFENVIKQWEDVRRENEMLRRELTDLREHHQCSEEKSMALEQQLHHERQCRQADGEEHQLEVFRRCQQLHQHVQERDQIQSRFDALLQKYEDARRETERQRSLRQMAEQRSEQLSLQYATMEKDYNDTMHERENVLHENNSLYEYKQQLLERNQGLDSANKALKEDVVTLKRRIDRIAAESNLEHRIVIEVPASADSTTMISTTGDEAAEVAAITRTALEKEVEERRTQAEMLQQTVRVLRREADTTRSTADAALGEQLRLTAEVDSMRGMCEKMRKDRDEAMAKLASALRDTDDMQRQREKVEQELKSVRDKLELDLSSSGVESSGVPTARANASPSHSRDSAIDNDLAEWDIETLEIPIVSCSKDEPLGVELRGGRDDIVYGQSVPIYVSAITKGSRFDGVLKVFDGVMQLNEIDVSNMERRSVTDMLKNSKNLKMVVKRRRLVGMKHISVQIDKLEKGCDNGLLFENGVYISKIKTSSAAARAGNLAVGDRIIYVNDIPVQGKSASEVEQLVVGFAETGLVLSVTKSPPVMSPMTPSVSAVAGFAAAAAGMMPKSVSQNQLRVFSPLQRKTVCDQSCQTTGNGGGNSAQMSSGTDRQSSTPAAHKSKGNILDKFHDKLFGSKDVKKQRVIATASVLPTSNDPLTLNSKGGWGHFPDHLKGGASTGPASSEFSSSLRHSSLRSSIRGSLTSASKDKIDQQREEQVLRQFDEMLRSEFDGVFKQNTGQPHEDPSSSPRGGNSSANGGGSTWPKYQCNNSSTPTKADGSNAGVNGRLSTTVTQRPRRPMQRPSLFPVFQAPPVTNPLSTAEVTIPPLDVASTSQSNSIRGHKDSRVGSQGYSPEKLASSSPQSSGVSSSRSAYSTPANRPLSYHYPYSSGGGIDDARTAAVASTLFTSKTTNDKRSSSGSRPASIANSYSSSRRSPRNVVDGPNYVDIDIVAAHPPVPQHHHLVKQHPLMIARAHPYHPPLTTTQQFMLPAPPSVISVPPASYPMPPPYRAPRMSPEPDYSDRQSLTSQSSSSLPRTGYLSGSSNPSLTRPFPRVKPPSQRKDRMSPYHQQQTWASVTQSQDRRIRISKNSLNEGLGISIDSHGSGSGVFIASVSENGPAARYGIQPGDRILDVCGINMRNADLDHARKVLGGLPKADDIEFTVRRSNPYLYDDGGGSRSVASTPRATPVQQLSSPRPIYVTATLPHHHGKYLNRDGSVQSTYSREHLHSISENELEEQRWVIFRKGTGADWPFTIMGGNAIGIFVDQIFPNQTVASGDEQDALRPGDRILELSGMNFRNLTLEQAMQEMQRKCDDQVSALVQYDERKYQNCKRGLAGDSFYVRVNIDREKSNTDELELRQGEVLYVDNTVFNGKLGRWRAWSLDPEGRHRQCGILPAKWKFEEELQLKRVVELSSVGVGAGGGGGGSTGGADGGSEGSGSRRGTIRRSLKFMRRSSRSSQHTRTPSKESSKDGDAEFPFLDPYQRVERLDYKRKRPVLVVGALRESFVARLVEDYPSMFARCVPECVAVDERRLEERTAAGLYVDYRRRERLVEVTSVAAVKDIMEKGFHCLLDVGPNGLERLQRLQIYPVVIQLRFSKGAKQVKELAEMVGVTPKLNSKAAKELLDKADQTDKYLTTINCQKAIVNVTCHANVDQTMRVVCQQIHSSVEHEQKKTIWIISSENL